MNLENMKMSMLLVILSIVFAAVAFNIFPMILEGADTLLATGNITEYSGMESSVKIGPTLLFIGMVLGSLATGFFGVYGTVSGIRGK